MQRFSTDAEHIYLIGIENSTDRYNFKGGDCVPIVAQK